MKKFAVILAAVTVAVSACHYGKPEAQSSLERNKEYKEKAADQGPEINPDYVKGGAKPAATDSAKTDSVAPVAAAPAAH